jgi:glycosyltransferase involved in cell wall biosynthesis
VTNVLSYIPGATFGGAHNQAIRLAPVLRERGYRILVLLPDEPGDAAGRLRAAGLDVEVMPLRRLRATANLDAHWQLARSFRAQVRRLCAFIESNSIDIVQLHGITSIDGSMAARSSHRPILWQLIDTRAPMALRRVLMPIVRHSGAVVMTTGKVLQKEFPGLEKMAPRVLSFFPPVSTEVFRPGTFRERDESRCVLRVEPGSRLILCLANMNPQKGLEQLLRAAALARRSGANWELRIRGAESPVHPEYVRTLRTLAAELGLSSATIGELEPGLTPQDFLRAGDFFALTPRPRSEGIPTAVLEAMASGLPVIASDVGGIREVVSSDRGILTSPDDVEAAVAALNLAATWPDGIYQRYVANCLDFAASSLGIEACADVHVAGYQMATA